MPGQAGRCIVAKSTLRIVMSKSSPASPSKPQAPAQVLTPNPAKASAVVQTPSGTLSITLAPAPTPSPPLYQNVSLWVGVITFLGVILTLLAAERRTKTELSASEARMKLELQSSRELAHQERITNTRRTVYLELIEEVSNVQEFLGSLATTEEPPNIRAGLEGLSAAVSKIGLVGEMETLILARELSVAVTRTLLKVIPMYAQVALQRSVQEEQTKRCIAARDEITRLKGEIATCKKTGNENAATLLELEAALEEANDKWRRYGSDLSNLLQALFRAQLLYSYATTEETNLVNRKFDDLLYAIRTELGLETSLERLRQSTSEVEAASQASIEEINAFGSGIARAATDVVRPPSNAPAEQNK